MKVKAAVVNGVNQPYTFETLNLAELKDDDFPYFRASERAYRWLKKHVENEEKE